MVRVRIASLRERGQSVSVGSDGQWLRISGAEQVNAATVVNGPIVAKRDGGEWSFTTARGRQPRWHGQESPVFSSIDPRRSSVALDGRDHPGTLRLVARSGLKSSAFEVINDVPLESYLPGVLAEELFDHWHEQAFCARRSRLAALPAPNIFISRAAATTT